nr:hypothetical protein [Tanacetum cinerariifolium]
GLGYSVVPSPPAQLYSSPKKDLSWTGLPEFSDDTVTDYSRPSPTVESTSGDDQNRNPFVFETVATPITPKPFIKFVKPKDTQSKSKTDETETPKKPPVKYTEQYRKPNKKPNAAILKTFGGNEATRKTKKNLLKQQYGNFKAEGKETLEKTFNRLQAIISQLEFMDMEIEQDDLNQKLLTSLAPEWLTHMIVWRNRSDLDTMSLDDLNENEEVNTASVPTASTQVSPAGANVAPASISLDTTCTYIASQSNGSQIKYEDINQIDEDDIEEMDIMWNMALLSMRADRYRKKTGKKISIQGTYVAGFDKSKVECFNCHKMGYFARECRAPRSQNRGRRDNYRQGSKVEEQAPKALMAIDGVEFAMMAKSGTDNEVFDNSLCFKACKKNTDSLNSQITKLTEKLGDTKNMLYHYKLGLSHVEARLVEFKNQEIKFYENIRGLEFSVECKANRIENLTNELETLKKEKEGLDSKLTGFKSASKDLDNLLESQRSNKNKEGLGYSVVPPPPAQVYSPPKKDMSWTGLFEFADDTIIDYTTPSPSVESNPDDLQNNSSSAFENEESTSSILSKPEIKFVKPADSPTVVKTDKKETVRKHTVKYVELYRKTSKRSNVRGNQNNLKSQQLGKNFVIKKACYNCGGFDHLSYDCGNSQNNINDKGYWDSGCSWHMTGNISYLTDYEPYDGGYVSFGQGGCKITGKGIIKTGSRLCREFKALMHKKFQMSAMGELNLFLGLQVLQKKDGIFLSQDKYIGDILKKFGYSDVRSSNTPMDKENP